MPDLEVSNLPPLAGAGLQATDPLPIADLSASETKKITAKDLVQYGITLIDANSIPSDKLNYTLPAGSVGTAELADGAVTAIKMADGSSGIVQGGPLPDGAFTGQLGLDLTDDLFYVWDGGEWRLVKASGSINDVVGDATGLVPVTVVIASGIATITASHADTTDVRQFLAGPTGAAGAVTARQIIGDDLPEATATSKGAVSVPGNGLKVTSGALAIDNDVTPNTAATMHVVEYNQFGLVVSGRAIEGGDLPTATDTTLGAVKAGTGLQVDSDGKINHINGIAEGTAAKVTYDAQGHITGSLPLTPDDLPEVNADSIIGEIGTDQLAECAVTAPKICDYATCLMQEDNPGAGDFLGQFWYTPSTAQLRVYSRGSGPQNIWLPVGFGALQANNLRWGGTFDASTDKIGAVTAIGTSEGLIAGAAFPPPSDELSGLYLVCQVAGNNCTQSNIAGVAFDGGDWALCLDGTQGWVIIDANTGGGGGGGGANYLNDLLDVTIGGIGGPFSTAPQLALSDRQLLKYDSGDGMWKNTDLIDGGSF